MTELEAANRFGDLKLLPPAAPNGKKPSGEPQPKAAIPAVAEALKDEAPDVRDNTAKALKEIEPVRTSETPADHG